MQESKLILDRNVNKTVFCFAACEQTAPNTSKTPPKTVGNTFKTGTTLESSSFLVFHRKWARNADLSISALDHDYSVYSLFVSKKGCGQNTCKTGRHSKVVFFLLLPKMRHFCSRSRLLWLFGPNHGLEQKSGLLCFLHTLGENKDILLSRIVTVLEVFCTHTNFWTKVWKYAFWGENERALDFAILVERLVSSAPPS